MESLLDNKPRTRQQTQKRKVEHLIASHIFKSYSNEEIRILSKIVEAFATNVRRYSTFGGLTWIFLRSATDDSIINWTDSIPLQRIDQKSLMSHWASTHVDAHDGAGIFGCYNGENVLMSLGVVLKTDLEHLFNRNTLPLEDRNRTGYTSGMYVAMVTDAVVVKISETRKITFFCSQNGQVTPEEVHASNVREKSDELLGQDLDFQRKHTRNLISCSCLDWIWKYAFRDTFYDAEEGDRSHDRLFRRPTRQVLAQACLSVAPHPCIEATLPITHTTCWLWRSTKEWIGVDSPPVGSGTHWSKGDGNCFKVRIPRWPIVDSFPRSSATRSMYTCQGFEIVRAGHKIDKIFGVHVHSSDFPKPPESSWSSTCPLPRVLCVNVQLPHQAGLLSWSTHPEDDAGCSGVGFFHVEEHTLTCLDSMDPPPYIDLFRKFVKKRRPTHLNAGWNTDGILKAQAICENLDDVIASVPCPLLPLINKYKEKEVLLTESTCVHNDHGGEWLEIAIDVRKFCFTAKRALRSLRGLLPSLSIHVGFMVQGVKDEDLPEGVLCDVRFHNANVFGNVPQIALPPIRPIIRNGSLAIHD